MIDQGVTAALAAHDANRNGDDSHTSRTGGRRTERIVRECTYQDFMKCKPLYFKGTEGVVELTQWFERMETVFRISNCPVENQVKFSTSTLLAGALTWWNSHVMTVSHDAAYAMTWANLRKKLNNKYCPRNKMKKLEVKLWNLKVKGTDVIWYNQRFQELALLCVRMFPEESDKIKRYVGGLPDMIHGNIVASKPKTMQEAVEMATELMDKKVITIVERYTENKRKFENTSQNNQNQQQQNKRQNTGRAYTAGTSEKKLYGGSKPLCAKCNYHHDGQKPTCFECGVQGHYKRECLKLKNNKNCGNQVGNDRAPAKVYVVGRAGTNPDSNVMTGELKFWPTCDPNIKECNGGHEMYEMSKEDLKKWYCYYDDDRKKINGAGLSFPEFLLVKYEENQEKGLIWDESRQWKKDPQKDVERLESNFGLLYKEVEFEVALIRIHVVVRFCLGVTTLVTP
ncbi:reverse transcriptase domain-containing protein [Tanacetum coccineum]|uniref:Reverse transcriptase domain-containing protein n=1 Tax=Tanacetum coccineum TaxID=301880 RepID=A0ABQ4YQ32_9ASTR